MKRLILPVVVALSLGGCCVISCNSRLPNSFVKVNSAVPATCTYEDKAGVREFAAPGEVLGMPRNGPGKLACSAKGYKPYTKTIGAQDWNPLTPLSRDADALRYYSEVELVLEAESPGAAR